eukprot:GILJ01008166.1.p1 GENE.GILJ01008166.1~~GILJ01008166.1.p1  ORF type:complete len:465 (-),score=43.39 GILJ01008166.1:179-1534(-)
MEQDEKAFINKLWARLQRKGEKDLEVVVDNLSVDEKNKIVAFQKQKNRKQQVLPWFEDKFDVEGEGTNMTLVRPMHQSRSEKPCASDPPKSPSSDSVAEECSPDVIQIDPARENASASLLNVPSTPNALASACSRLLALPECSSSDTKKYRIEYSFADKLLQLRYDPVVWYQHLSGEPAEKVAQANDCIKAFRAKSHKLVPADPAGANPTPYEDLRACFDGRDCKKKKNCKFHHNVCSAEMDRRDGVQRPCHWFAHPNLVLPGLFPSPQFVAYARKEPIRDILVSPVDHMPNTALCVNEEFWGLILSKLDILDGSTLKVAFNFGEWETATSLDTYATDCHAHAHLLVSQKVMENLSKLYSGCVGRMGNPPDYNKQDADELQFHITGDSFDLLTKSVSSIEKKVSTIENQVTEILSILKSSAHHRRRPRWKKSKKGSAARAPETNTQIPEAE